MGSIVDEWLNLGGLTAQSESLVHTPPNSPPFSQIRFDASKFEPLNEMSVIGDKLQNTDFTASGNIAFGTSSVLPDLGENGFEFPDFTSTPVRLADDADASDLLLNELAYMTQTAVPLRELDYATPSTSSSRSASPALPATPQTPVGIEPCLGKPIIDLTIFGTEEARAQTTVVQEAEPVSAVEFLRKLEAESTQHTQGRSRPKAEPKYRCMFGGCDKRFRQRAHLETHVRSHTGERPFKCPMEGCPKSFSQQCNLRTHLRSHTGEKPFECDICGKGFSQRGNLRNHRLTHSTDRPLACQLDGCTKKFNQLGNLKAHHNSVHSATVNAYMSRLALNSPEEDLSPEERRQFASFCAVYKNSSRLRTSRSYALPALT